jgi:hypothetical protein
MTDDTTLAIITLITICVLIYYLKNCSSNITENFEDGNIDGNLDDEQQDALSYESQNEREESDSLMDNYDNTIIHQLLNGLPNLKKNMLIKYNSNNKNTNYLFPVHKILFPIIKGFNTDETEDKYLIVMNNGRLYTQVKHDYLMYGPLDNSLINSVKEDLPVRMIALDDKLNIYGVGYDNKLYKKALKGGIISFESKWGKVENDYINNLGIIYITMYKKKDEATGLYDVKWIVIDTNGQMHYTIAYNIDDKLLETSLLDNNNTKFTPVTVNDIPVIKIYFSKHGHMFGIGADLRLYKKKSLDWINSNFDQENNSESLLYDIIYDNDGLLMGLSVSESLGILLIQKQKEPYYQSKFYLMDKVDKSQDTYNYRMNTLDIVRTKNGIYMDVSNHNEFGENSVEDAIEYSKLKETELLRDFCYNNKIINDSNKYENYDLLNKVSENNKMITEFSEKIKDFSNNIKLQS